MTWRMLSTITHLLMVHARVSEAYMNCLFMYTADHIFPVLPIKYLINKDGKPTTPFKLATGTKKLVSYLCVLFCPFVVQKSTAHVGTNTLNMCHQAQKGFRGIFVGIPQNQKGYLVYLPHKRKIVSSYDIVFDKILSSALAYTSQLYSEAMYIPPSVSYITYAISSKGQIADIITSAHFEEGNLLLEYCNGTESGNESDDNSSMPPLISESEMNAMSAVD